MKKIKEFFDVLSRYQALYGEDNIVERIIDRHGMSSVGTYGFLVIVICIIGSVFGIIVDIKGLDDYKYVTNILFYWAFTNMVFAFKNIIKLFKEHLMLYKEFEKLGVLKEIVEEDKD